MVQFNAIAVLLSLALAGFSMSSAAQAGSFEPYEKRKAKALANLDKYPNPDTARVEALINVLYSAVFLKERKDVAPYLYEAFILSRKLDYMDGLGKSYLQKALYHKSASEYPTALIYLDSALNTTESINSDSSRLLKAKVLGIAASIYYSQENNLVALDYYLEALKYIPPKDSVRIITTYVFVTLIYTNLNNFEKAEEYAAKGIAAAETISSRNDKNFVYFAVVDLYLKKNDLGLATFYLDKLSHVTDNPDQVQEIFGYFLKRGIISSMQNKTQEAYGFFKQANAYAVRGGHAGSQSTCLYYLSSTALKLGHHAEAKKYAEGQLALANKMKTISPKIDALVNLSEYHSKIGDTKQAIALSRQAFNLKDSLISENNNNQNKILGAIYESQKQQREIARLHGEKQKYTASENRKTLINNFLLAAVLALLLVIYLTHKNFKKGKQLNKQQEELQNQKIVELQKNKQLFRIEAMLKGQEEERGRIAKDLHDGVGSLLSGTKMSLLNVKEKIAVSGDEKKLFEKSLNLLDTTIGDLRKVAQNLMPEALVKFGLHAALEDFCNFIQYSSGINVVCIQLEQKRIIDSAAQVHIYRIIQELVNNAIKHASPKKILVQLSILADRTTLVVEDDGKGYDLSGQSKSKGAGLSNIIYRVNYFNGTIDVSSSPGNGTSTNIELMV